MLIMYPPALKYQLYRSVHNYSIVGHFKLLSHLQSWRGCSLYLSPFSTTLQMSATRSITNRMTFKHVLNIVIIFCLTWQEVHAPVYIRGAEGRRSDDLSRFWSHLTEIQINNSVAIATSHPFCLSRINSKCFCTL